MTIGLNLLKGHHKKLDIVSYSRFVEKFETQNRMYSLHQFRATVCTSHKTYQSTGNFLNVALQRANALYLAPVSADHVLTDRFSLPLTNSLYSENESSASLSYPIGGSIDANGILTCGYVVYCSEFVTNFGIFWKMQKRFQKKLQTEVYIQVYSALAYTIVANHVTPKS